MPSNAKEHELLPILLAQAADAQPQQPQRTGNQFLLPRSEFDVSRALVYSQDLESY
jgi:hypothetical protein